MSENTIQWKTIVERQQTPIYMDTLMRGQRRPFLPKALGFDFELNNVKRVVLPLRIDLSEVAALKHAMRSQLTGEAYLAAFGERCLAACQTFTAKSKATSLALSGQASPDPTFLPERTTLESQSSPSLWKTFRSYLEETCQIGAFLNSVAIADLVLQDILDEVLERVPGRKKAKSSLLIPSQPTHEIDAIREILRMGAAVQDGSFGASPADIAHILSRLDPVDALPHCEIADVLRRTAPALLEQMRDFASRYQWMNALFYRGELMTWRHVASRLGKTISQSCATRLNETRRLEQVAAERYQTTLDSMKFNDEERALVELVRRFLFLRTFRLDTFFIAQSYMRPVYERVAKKLGVSYDDLLFMTIDEMERAFHGESAVNLVQVNERKGAYAVVMLAGQVTWYSGEACRELARKEGLEPRSANEIEGIGVQTGKARGRAVLVLTLEDLPKVQKGDVLVTTMTLPAMMPGIELCCAIVTNEGGMLCHAAIVSQELRLPCVIATGDATRVFRDGDLLDVDSTSGIVRKVM